MSPKTTTPQSQKPSTTTSTKPAAQPKAKATRRGKLVKACSRIGDQIQKLEKKLAPASLPSTLFAALANARQSADQAAFLASELPENWGVKEKASKDINVGDHVGLKDNAKIKEIYGSAIMVSELNDMVVKASGKMLRCETAQTKATVFIPVRHVVKIAHSAQAAA